MTEELAFEQGLGDRGAVDRDKRAAGTRAQPVDRVGEQLLAGAALAEQQNRDIGRRQLFDVAQHPQHFRAGGDDAVDRRAGRSLDQPAVLGFELEHLLGAADDHPQHVDVDRLLVKVVGAERDRAQRVLAGLVAGRDDDLGRRRQLADFGQRGKPFGGAVGIGRQPEIEDRHRRMVTAHQRHRLLPVRGGVHPVLGKRPAQLTQQTAVVVDDQQRAGGGGRGAHAAAGGEAAGDEAAGGAAGSRSSTSGKMTRIVVPAPGREATSRSPPAVRMSSRVWNAPMP